MRDPAPALLVDDDEDDRFFLRAALSDAGLSDIREAADGRSAIEYLDGAGPFSDRALHPAPAFVVLDLKMPGCDGCEVLAWIRADPRTRCLPVLMLTGSNIASDVERCYRLGANTYFTKPSQVAELKALAGAIKAYWCDRAEFPPAAGAGPTSI